MKLVITEKNIAAEKISQMLAVGKPKKDEVYSVPVYRFTHDGEEWVTIGLKGHILGVDFPDQLVYRKRGGWMGIEEDGSTFAAQVPDTLPKPPFKKRKPFTEDGVELKQWKILALPYLVYAPLVKTPAEKGIIRALKNLAGKADSIVIATDFDREGELIGSDAKGIVTAVASDIPIHRARYSAITKEEITHAFDNLVEVDQDLADAGESRQYIDLIWGAVLTRYLTVVKRGGLNTSRPAGRVQTPTLALVAKRERERLAFKPEDYWVIKGHFSARGEEFFAPHATARFKEEAKALRVMDALADAKQAHVESIEKKTRRIAPPTPFNTTSLQAAAAAEGISPARTMRIAETLYMNGLTSYPRVDNTVYPASLDLSAVTKKLGEVAAYAPYVQKLLASGPLRATRGKKETTDHPPIYPTGAGNPDKMRPEEWKLYNLIARRFLATLSDPAVVEGTKVTLDVAGEKFAVRGDTLSVPGFRGIYPYGLKKDDQLPSLTQGEDIDFLSAEIAKKQTEPPARYSQGKLIQEMESLGLGTKSTRHSIIERLYEVHYIQNEPIEPTALGLAICDALEKFAPHITSPDMTAQLEEGMDSIAAGNATQGDVVNHSRDLLAEIMDDLIPRKEELSEAISDAVVADSRVGACPTCGHDLLIKNSPKTRQSFVGCSGWPECNVTYPLPTGKLEATDEICPLCNTPQIKVTPFRSKPQMHCLNPQCETNVEPDVDVGPCPACAAAGKEERLIARKSPRTLKRFIRCTNYDECNTSYPLPQKGKLSYEGAVCETCGAPQVVISTTRGPWRLCVNMECPAKEEEAKAKAAKKGASKSTKKTKTAKKGTSKATTKTKAATKKQ